MEKKREQQLLREDIWSLIRHCCKWNEEKMHEIQEMEHLELSQTHSFSNYYGSNHRLLKCKPRKVYIYREVF